MNSEGYVSLKSIDRWCDYYSKNKYLRGKPRTLDDSRQFSKIKINPYLNKDFCKKVSLYRGDISKLEVDAIVNSANSIFKHDGGVDSIIHDAAGPLLEEECRTLGGCRTGDAKITGAYNLRAKYVIHTVGPQDGSPSKLESCYQKCYSFQKDYNIRSFAFPCIATGVYKFPNRLAANIALSVTRKFLESPESAGVERIRRVSDTTHVTIQRVNRVAPAYDPLNVEKTKYDSWDKRNLFKAENNSSKPRFSMILPPPNVTGKLHLGHALACTVQDVIARHKRSTGHNVLWLPGIDHAGIATQGIVEKHLKSQGVNRQDIGREEFVDEVWKWKEKHGHTIFNQLRTLGCSLDWSRQAFTMDPAHTRAVNKAFLDLCKQGYIYRKKALVNWCNALQSTVSDIEVDNIQISGPTDVNVPGYDSPVKFGQLYNLVYKIDDSTEEIVVSTTTPETMLGDTAIAVNPKDARYSHLRGKKAVHPFRDTLIPIIFDAFVDMKLGSGAVKITPAHSKVDYEISKRHNLPLIEVIDEDGLMKNTEIFDDMKKYTCREEIVQKLNDMKLLKGVTPHQMTLPICNRTGDVIDYLPKEQWFLTSKSLNEKAAMLVKGGHLKLIPDKFVKNWLDWTGDNRDWCISRQLWWGHQIPAYKCTNDQNVVWIPATEKADARTQGAKLLRCLPEDVETEKDTDVLDTWFSSAVYPFAVLGWPHSNENKDFKQFYPLSLMATAHDILGFWVHRMVILGLALTDKLPFNEVLLHGLICDSKGAKMSKSKGNVIDPVDVINGIKLEEMNSKSKKMYANGLLSEDELSKALDYHEANFSNTNGIPRCGADALRFTLLSHDIKSHFINFDVAMCNANKLFCNKIWQSVNYTGLAYTKLKKIDGKITTDDLTVFDRWILSKLASMVKTVNTSMENYDFHLATKALRLFTYNQFCDFYLETTKAGFEDKNPKLGYAHAHTLSVVLNTTLRCLAPFMIYLTDELIEKIPNFKSNIIHNYVDTFNDYFDFPKYKDFEKWRSDDAEKKVNDIMNTITQIRELKGLYNISNKLRPGVYINTTNSTLMSDFKKNEKTILNLTKCSKLTFGDTPTDYVLKTTISNDTQVGLELSGEEAREAILRAREKLHKRIIRTEALLAKLESKYSSIHYLTTVSKEVQMSDKEKLLKKKKELKELQKLI
ncbi:unnamed protein product [Arctia plantaginis]|uniref:valine--tRNA ligase n=1 Tax=Arctia plantaginis TaxID=874455 RepID=A0A8S1AHG8_ARCPL|nr:unnamed protein product [Arctia plantaginis]